MDRAVHVEALNLRHLRAWAVVVEEGSITAGAKRLSVSQPALSQQLKALEDFFGSPLLERLPRGIKLTPIGRALLNEANATLATSERLLRSAAMSAGLQEGVLEVATLPTLVEGIMLEPIKAWQDAHPNVAIRIREFAAQKTLVEAFEMGLADIAVGVRPPSWSGDVVPLGWDEFAVLVPDNHPLFHSAKPVDLQDLRDDRWVLYGRSNGLSDYMTTVCASAGFTPVEAVRTSQVSVAVKLACAGLGPALIPRLNIPDECRAHANRLSQPFAWEITAFARSNMSEAGKKFVTMIETEKFSPKPQDAVTLPG